GRSARSRPARVAGGGRGRGAGRGCHFPPTLPPRPGRPAAASSTAPSRARRRPAHGAPRRLFASPHLPRRSLPHESLRTSARWSNGGSRGPFIPPGRFSAGRLDRRTLRATLSCRCPGGTLTRRLASSSPVRSASYRLVRGLPSSRGGGRVAVL